MQDQAAVLGLILVTMTTLVGCGSAHKRDGGVEGNGMPAGATPGMAAATAPRLFDPATIKKSTNIPYAQNATSDSTPTSTVHQIRPAGSSTRVDCGTGRFYRR